MAKQDKPALQDLWNLQKAAELLERSRSALYHAIERGELPCGTTATGELFERPRLHGQSDSVEHKPGAWLTHSKGTGKLAATDPVFGVSAIA